VFALGIPQGRGGYVPDKIVAVNEIGH